MKLLLLTLLLATAHLLSAQNIAGQVTDADSKLPLEFVSIGVIKKGEGTVSDQQGRYSIAIDEAFDGDSLRFSCIGYEPKTYKLSDFRQMENQNISLQAQEWQLKEVAISSKGTKEKTLGNNYTSRLMQAAFRDNKKGYEMGVLLRIKKPTLLKELVCNMDCSYDSVYYRMNVYKVNGEMDFENILTKPIYLIQKMEEKQKTVSLDLSPYEIAVDHDILVTLEHIRDLGEGKLLLPAKFNAFKGSTTYFRKTSQGEWEKAPVKVSLSMHVAEER